MSFGTWRFKSSRAHQTKTTVGRLSFLFIAADGYSLRMSDALRTMVFIIILRLFGLSLGFAPLFCGFDAFVGLAVIALALALEACRATVGVLLTT